MENDPLSILLTGPETQGIAIPYCADKLSKLSASRQEKGKLNPVVYGCNCTCGKPPYGCEKLVKP